MSPNIHLIKQKNYTFSKVLMNSTHDAMSYYQYFMCENITSFIDLNGKDSNPPFYKNDFTIDKDGVSVCPSGCFNIIKNY